MKRVRIYFVAVMFLAFVSSCSNPDEAVNMNSIGFLVEPQCESQVRQYLDKMNNIPGSNTALMDITYKKGAITVFNYYGVIRSEYEDTKQLEGYVNGAMRNCRANRKYTFDLSDEKSIKDFIQELKYTTKHYPNAPIFIEYANNNIYLWVSN